VSATDSAGHPPDVLGDRRDRIRHDGPRLLWSQVADDLRADIRAGRLPAGARLPAYEDMAVTYGVATLTVRRAIRELRAEGLVVVVVGRGTYVREQ
jgi:GntR family transcriptional regulator